MRTFLFCYYLQRVLHFALVNINTIVNVNSAAVQTMAIFLCYIDTVPAWSSQASILGTVPAAAAPPIKTGLLGDCPPEYRNAKQLSTNVTDKYVTDLLA